MYAAKILELEREIQDAKVMVDSNTMIWCDELSDDGREMVGQTIVRETRRALEAQWRLDVLRNAPEDTSTPGGKLELVRTVLPVELKKALQILDSVRLLLPVRICQEDLSTGSTMLYDMAKEHAPAWKLYTRAVTLVFWALVYSIPIFPGSKK